MTNDEWHICNEPALRDEASPVPNEKRKSFKLIRKNVQDLRMY